MATPSRKLGEFVCWMQQNGIEYSTALSFETDRTVVAGTGVRAVCDLKKDEVIAKIPKKACLTVKTTGAADILEEAGLAGGLGLTVAVMYERSRKELSPWFSYLSILPFKEMLPFVWSEKEIDDLLIGTELHKAIKEDRVLMEEDWQESVLPLTHQYQLWFPREYFKLEDYLAAKSVVASRSFDIDDFHGYGMVPFADMFNHKTCAEHVHFSASPFETSESSDCGTLEITEDMPMSGHGREFVSGSDDGGDDDPEILEMVLIKDVKQRSEVFNTYGQSSNAALLLRYGFTECNNPFDIVNIDMDIVMEVLSTSFTRKHLARRKSLWRKAGFSPYSSQGSEYFEITKSGKPQIEMLLLIFLVHASSVLYQNLSSFSRKIRGNIKILLHILGSQATQQQFQSYSKNILMSHSLLRKSNMENIGLGSKKIQCRFLTPAVCKTFLAIIEARDSQYPTDSVDQDLSILNHTSPDNFQVFHSLSLRVSERQILRRCQHRLLANLKRSSFAKAQIEARI